MRNVLLFVLLLLFGVQAQAAEWEQSARVSALFHHAGVEGTFVLYDVTSARFVTHDRVRAEERFVPASTFKILNTMVGLSVGAVEDVDEVLPYGGQPQPFKSWEKDMGLKDAIAASNAAIYQELARRIGLESMRDHVVEVDYGNAQIGSAVDTFWLSGPLKISAVEQTLFIAKLAQNELPFTPEVHKATQDLIKMETGEGWELYGKTGWENAPGQGIGWWVGWVRSGGRLYAFALNMDIRNPTDANRRVELGKESLRALGVL